MTTHNLPKQLTPFVGREIEIVEINTALSRTDCRLLSLIGPGGIGKTRLAVEIAMLNQGNFVDGVFYVPLQPLVSADGIVTAIAASLKFEFYDGSKSIQEQLLDYLSSKNLFLVLDDFTNVLEGAEFVTSILSAAPQIKILVTSREALKLRQEWMRPVTGMLYPDDVYTRDIATYSAVQLFIDRAQQLRSNFVIEDELPHIIRICQLVGGMPLGIELVVAWLTTLSCEEIITEIQKNLDLLTAQMRDIPERHRSIRAVFDSTWQMLTEQERTVFMRLSVFRGTPTRQAIQSVTAASLLALSGLVNKALLIPIDNGRYQIHELLRQYAYEKLEESDAFDKIKSAHSDYYLCFMQDRQADIHGRRQIEAVHEISLEFENIRAAWNWALEQMNYDGIGMAVETLCVYLHFRSRWKQDSYMVTQAQERFAPRKGEKPHPVWGMVASRNYLNYPDPEQTLNQALELAQEDDNQAEVGLCLLLLGHHYAQRHDHNESVRHFELGIPVFEAVGDKYHLAGCYGFAALQYRLKGDYEKSIEYNEISLNMRRAIGDIDGQVYATAEFSNTMFIMGQLHEAEQYRHEAILLAEQSGSPWNIAWQKWELATYFILGLKGDLPEAKRVIEESEQLLNDGIHMKGTTISTYLLKSLFAALEENYDEARKFGAETHHLAQNDAWFPIFTWGTLVAASGQADYETVREYSCNFLRHFFNIRVVPFSIMGLTFAAILAAYDDDDAERATELLSLSICHPSSMSGWLRLWPLIERLQADLDNELGADVYQAAWQRGQTLDWETVVRGLIAEYSGEGASENGHADISIAMLEANSELQEPLSERELEVLYNIAEGYTNKEIAERLFVGVSTVKKHITHIYGKLQVENRTQALLKSQELKLV